MIQQCVAGRDSLTPRGSHWKRVDSKSQGNMIIVFRPWTCYFSINADDLKTTTTVFVRLPDWTLGFSDHYF